ncbi:MHS family MFS transporter [Amycolatopsis sp. K13G38]|uniref:MHS family MFS transporter n=2 Tax=Amycolatopsis acididurans TaxID=2724524 RepID=A0ABX1J6V9_9PSEU|nr:MHS family MFS transporter [Amycolatopsis acididurans]
MRQAEPVGDESAAARSGGRSFGRIAFASLIGTLIDGYDFVLYSVAAALVFPKVFFPSLGGAAGTIASLATLGVAFVARPIGALLFGHFGDRLGRKRTLIWAILGMGIGTTLMGVIPSANTIGVAAPIIIVILRAVQGLAVGGEWAGSVLFVTEHAPLRRRGLYSMFPQLGHSLPTALAPAILLLVGVLSTPETFIAWGWRVPFLASAVLVVIGLYIRLKVEETPVFAKSRERGQSGVPVLEAFKHQSWTMVRGIGVSLTTITFVYVAQSFVANYGVEHIHLSRNQVLAVSALSGLFYAVFTVLSAFISDRIGRRRMIGGAHVLGVVWGLLLFPVLNFGTFPIYAAALCVTMTIAGLAYGAVGAFLPEQFPTQYRFTAAGFSYQITGVIGGGIAPLLAPVIISSYGTTAFGVVLGVLCVFAAVCTFSLKDKTNESMDWNDPEQG